MPSRVRDFERARAEFRAIFAELAPGAGDRELARAHPVKQVRQLADAGFGALRVPVEFGGFGVDIPTLFGLLAEAGAADSNLPQILRGHFTTVEILRRTDDPTLQSHWLPRIAEGALFGNAQSELTGAASGLYNTKMRLVAGRREVSGIKFYSTGSLFADFIRVAVEDEEGFRTYVVVSAQHSGTTHVDDWDGIGQRLTGSGTTRFDAVPVEEHGELGQYQEDLRFQSSFEQLTHLANLVGIAHSLVTETADVIRARKRTSPAALSQAATSDPDVLAVAGLVYTRWLTAQSLLRSAAEALDDADRDGSDHAYGSAYVTVSAAQVAIIEAVLDAATIAFNAGGSSAVREGVHLDRHWRNARTLASHNPVVYKPRLIGHHVVNGTTPTPGYHRRHRSRADGD